jgi:spore maturation protein CgeB
LSEAPQLQDSAFQKSLEGERVLVVGSYAYIDSFEWHVTDSLRHMGCTVELFNTYAGISGLPGLAVKVSHKLRQAFLREPERQVERRLLSTIGTFAPTVVLVLLGNQISPKAIARIRRQSKTRIICWCQDQMTTLGRQFLLGGEYDAVFVKDKYMQDLFSRMIRSTQFYYLPEACNPRMHRPIELSASDRATYGCDVMIAGSLYYYRQEILRQFDGMDLKVWGYRPDWLIDRLPARFMGRDVHGDDKVRAARAAKVCVNTLHYAEVNGLNCRAFELAGCGGFQLITSVPALAEHFIPGAEIAIFSTVDELIDKTRYYLGNPDEAKAIAERGRLRAHKDHTYEHRLSTILRIALR